MEKATFDRTLGQRLRLARKATGLKQEQAAILIGCGRSQIANIEAGRSTLSAWQLLTVAAAYGQPVAYFYGEAALTVPQLPPGIPLHLAVEARDLAARLLAWAGSVAPGGLPE